MALPPCSTCSNDSTCAAKCTDSVRHLESCDHCDFCDHLLEFYMACEDCGAWQLKTEEEAWVEIDGLFFCQDCGKEERLKQRGSFLLIGTRFEENSAADQILAIPHGMKAVPIKEHPQPAWHDSEETSSSDSPVADGELPSLEFPVPKIQLDFGGDDE